MRIKRPHNWDLTPKEAVATQRRLAMQIDVAQRLERWNLIAAADVSYNRFSNRIFAAVIVWDRELNRVIEKRTANLETRFPYVSGLLSFREAPAMLKALAKLRNVPDVLLVDGHGIAHPRQMGLACHVGLWLPCPTIGVAKSRLFGTNQTLHTKRGRHVPLCHNDVTIGCVYRSKMNCLPLYISPGHRIDLASSLAVVRDCIGRRRLPEPSRLAHEAANEVRRAHKLR